MRITDANDNYVDVKIQSFDVKTQLSWRLERLSSLKYAVLDRGVNADKYECSIETYGTQSYCESVLAILQTQRYGDITGEALVLSEFADNKGEAIFGNNVDYTSSINCMVINTPKMENVDFKMFKLTFELRALGVTFDDVTAGLINMHCIWSGWVGGEPEWDRTVKDTYYNDNFVSVVKNNDRKFVGKFTLTTDLSRNLLEYYRTHRGIVSGTVPLSWIGIDHAFGIGKTYYDYEFIITDLKIEQLSPLYCIATIELTDVRGID